MGKDCRTGINSNIMPGIKIGSNSIVGAGVTLMEDLESNKIAFFEKTSYVVKDNKFDLDIKKRDEIKKKLSK